MTSLVMTAIFNSWLQNYHHSNAEVGQMDPTMVFNELKLGAHLLATTSGGLELQRCKFKYHL